MKNKMRGYLIYISMVKSKSLFSQPSKIRIIGPNSLNI